MQSSLSSCKIEMSFLIRFCLFATFVVAFGFLSVTADDPLLLDQLHRSTYDIIKLRGYKAQNHYFNTPDGYTINIVSATNPLINGGKSGLISKDPVLFVHGIPVNSTEFVLQSYNARPKNYANLQAGCMSIKCLNKLLLDDPASSSLVFTLLNFGHEVWLINFRGTSASMGVTDPRKEPYKNLLANIIETPSGGGLFSGILDRKKRDLLKGLLGGALEGLGVSLAETIGNLLTPQGLATLDNTFNPGYWNFSLDQEVKYDLPMAIDYVLEKTGRNKLSLVSHSTGGGRVLMSLASVAGIEKKINKCLIWAPVFNPATANVIGLTLPSLPLIMSILIPFPPPAAVAALSGLLATFCQSETPIPCETVFDALFGDSGLQENIEPGIQGTTIDSTSSHVIAQVLQAGSKKTMYKYDFGSASLNMKAYGQPEPPIYDLSKIKLKNMAFWGSSTDVIVPIPNLIALVKKLSVPAQLNFINQTGVAFDHVGYIFQKKTAELVNIPGLHYLES